MITEIFNDVLGPVMRGPSSSHTAGPARIGKWMSGLVGEPARVIMSRTGSYAAMFASQGSDRGFLGGLLGFSPDDEALIFVLDTARERGIEVTVNLLDEAFDHPNFARILVTDRAGRTADINGAFHEVLVFGAHDREVLADGPAPVAVHSAPGFLRASYLHRPTDELLRRLGESGAEMFAIPPVLPCPVACNEKDLPFTTGDQILERFGSRRLSDASLIYERAVTGRSDSETLARAQDIFAVVESAVTDGFRVTGGGLCLAKQRDWKGEEQQ